MSDTCGLISGAIQQSGSAQFDLGQQESNYGTTYLNDLTLSLLSSSSSDPDQNVDMLRKLPPYEVYHADFELFYLSDRPNNIFWAPIKYDGTFYKEDALKKRDEGRVCTGNSLI